MAKFKVGDKVKDPEGVIRTVARVSVKDGKELVEYAYHGNMKLVAGGNWADDVTLANATCNSTNPVVAKAMNACGTATNASDDFVTADFIFKVERAENPLNDFIHYEVKGVDKGSLPRTRKDMLIDKVKRLLADEKRKVASLESGLRALEQVK